MVSKGNITIIIIIPKINSEKLWGTPQGCELTVATKMLTIKMQYEVTKDQSIFRLFLIAISLMLEAISRNITLRTKE